MDHKLNDLLRALDSEIDKKCLELKQKEREQRNIRLFIYLCGLFIIVPIVMIFTGINIITVFIPIVLFVASSMFLLSPIVFNSNLGGVHSERYL